MPQTLNETESNGVQFEAGLQRLVEDAAVNYYHTISQLAIYQTTRNGSVFELTANDIKRIARSALTNAMKSR